MNIAPLVVMIRPPGTALSDRLSAFRDYLVTALMMAQLFEAKDVDVFGTPEAPQSLLPGSAGLVWGTLFDRMTSARLALPGDIRFPDVPIDQFVERHWGGYLLIRAPRGKVEILRDPSGAIPCYHARVDGADLFTTRIALLTDAGLFPPEIDWTILTQSLVYRDLRPPRTALRGVSELMPGNIAICDRGQVEVRTIWSPWHFTAAEREIHSAADAAEQVQRTATNCVRAWGRSFERPLVEVSGGLDSSIVAAILAGAGVNPACVTFAAAAGDPDETPYARAAANHLGLRLEVLRANVADVDLTYSHARDLPRSSARGFAQAHDVKLRALAAQHGADAFFSGGGGDNVFAYLKSVLPVIDFWKRGGGGFLATIGDVAALAEVGIWHVFAQTIRRALRVRSARQWLIDERFLSDVALRDLPFPNGHPWIDAPGNVLPGKRVHGHSLIVIQNHLESFDRLRDAPVVSPLLSQPLVELCMSIPTWLWCRGGINRAVARWAFADRLPRAIIERRTKGAFDSYSAQVFGANRHAIQEMLLSGALASRGLIDIPAIEAKLVPDVADRSEMLRILELVDAEAWVSAWSSRSVVRLGS